MGRDEAFLIHRIAHTLDAFTFFLYSSAPQSTPNLAEKLFLSLCNIDFYSQCEKRRKYFRFCSPFDEFCFRRIWLSLRNANAFSLEGYLCESWMKISWRIFIVTDGDGLRSFIVFALSCTSDALHSRLRFEMNFQTFSSFLNSTAKGKWKNFFFLI